MTPMLDSNFTKVKTIYIYIFAYNFIPPHSS